MPLLLYHRRLLRNVSLYWRMNDRFNVLAYCSIVVKPSLMWCACTSFTPFWDRSLLTTTAFVPPQDHMPGGRFYTSDGVGGAIQETYTSGSTIEAEFFITAHHRGFIELRLCDETHVTQECLLKYEPLERVRFEDDYTYSAQPIDPDYPGRFFLNPVCAFGQQSDRTYSGYKMTGRFKLPEGVTCDHCVIQMWWVTANSCVPPDYEDFQFPTEWAGCAGDGGSGFYNEGGSPCLGSTRAEEFWNW